MPRNFNKARCCSAKARCLPAPCAMRSRTREPKAPWAPAWTSSSPMPSAWPPRLDELKPDAKRVATALRNGIGQMPSYNGKLSDAQIAALAAYVAKASGGSK